MKKTVFINSDSLKPVGKTIFTTTSSKLWKCISWMWEMVGKKQKRTTTLKKKVNSLPSEPPLASRLVTFSSSALICNKRSTILLPSFSFFFSAWNKTRRPTSQNPQGILFCRTRRKDQEQQQRKIDPPNKTKYLADSFCEENNFPPIKWRARSSNPNLRFVLRSFFPLLLEVTELFVAASAALSHVSSLFVQRHLSRQLGRRPICPSKALCLCLCLFLALFVAVSLFLSLNFRSSFFCHISPALWSSWISFYARFFINWNHMSKEVFCVLPLMVQVQIYIRYTSSHAELFNPYIIQMLLILVPISWIDRRWNSLSLTSVFIILQPHELHACFHNHVCIGISS